MHFLQHSAFVETPRGAIPRWICALGVVHAVLCATGLTFHFL